MRANIGSLDKTIRMIAGVLLIILAATGVIGAWGWVGIVPLATGLLNICPAYSVFGISTCKTRV